MKNIYANKSITTYKCGNEEFYKMICPLCNKLIKKDEIMSIILENKPLKNKIVHNSCLLKIK